MAVARFLCAAVFFGRSEARDARDRRFALVAFFFRWVGMSSGRDAQRLESRAGDSSPDDAVFFS